MADSNVTKISINVNLGLLMGTIISDIREYKTDKKLICEFEIEIKNYAGKQTNQCVITCVSEGTQAELIIKRKKNGDDILVTGYLGDVDIGHGPTKYGHHKFRITGVHFKYLNFINFSGRILTQPAYDKETKRAEFFVGTYRFHQSVPIQPCKIKIVCEKKIANIVLAFSELKTVGEYIQIIGFLDTEEGSHIIRAKRLELLLPNSTKEPVFNKIKEENQNEHTGEGDTPSSDQGNRNKLDGDQGNSGDDDGVKTDKQAPEETPESIRNDDVKEVAATNKSNG